MSESYRLASDRPGERLDQFLARRLPFMSRAQAQRLIAGGRVLVPGESAKSSLKLAAGRQVEVEVADPQPIAAQPEAIPLSVVHEDADLLVIDKPPGMPVHPGPGHEHATVVNAVLALCPDLAGIGDALRPGIVHRLDMNTSGLLIVAKNGQAQHALSLQMAERAVRKEYLALVEGVPQAQGIIDAPVGRHPGQRRQMAVVANGRPARTHFTALGRAGANTLILARLETGRTHQIRVHFAATGHPVIGDAVYGHRSDLVERQFLHAWRLGFRHPTSGTWLALEAPLPEDLQQALRTALARADTANVTRVIDVLLQRAAAISIAHQQPETPTANR